MEKLHMKSIIKSLAVASALVATATVSVASMAADETAVPVGAFVVNHHALALIDRIDVKGKGFVSKAEFIAFMEAEFNYLDQNKAGAVETRAAMNKEYLSRVEID